MDRSRHDALRPPSPQPVVPRRRRWRVRGLEVLLAVASLAVANALAGFLTGPELYGPPGARGTMAARTMFPSPREEAKARAVERFQRTATYVAFNILAVSTLAYLLLARRLERKRRQVLGIPEGLDESEIDLGVDGRPRSASEYRPSEN